MALDGDTVVAIARFDLAANAEFAEFAIVVADAYQRQGLGRDLMTRLMAAARAGGVRRLYGEVLAENVRMLAFVRGLGFSVHCDPLDRRVMLVSLDLTV